MQTPFIIHARTLTGLEGVLARELEKQGATDIEPKNRLVICRGDLRVLYAANLWCRTAIRILRPLAKFAAANERALYDGIQAIDWSRWMGPQGTIAFDANVFSSFSTHSLYVAQLAKDAVVDQFREKTGERPSVDLERPSLRVAITLYKNQAQVYVDASGDSLHKRGYRRKAGEAPLSETLAAGILALSEWDGKSPLLDPMCGSGTFCIEAGLMAARVAPGLLRDHFGFQGWADYDSGIWNELLAQAKAAVRKDVQTSIVGVEIDPRVVGIARENVNRAGLTGLVRIERGDFFAWAPATEPGTIVMNPPYDERLPVDNVAELYNRIGERLDENYRGWSAHILSGNPKAAQYFGIKPAKVTPLFNASIECRLLQLNPGNQVRTETLRELREKPAEDNPKWRTKAETLANRLRKNAKHYGKWAKREGVSCFRVYDWDIPELAFIVDVYGDRMHFAEIERNIEHSPLEHPKYIQYMMKHAADALGIAPEKVYFKKRKPQKAGQGGFQYVPHAETGEFLEMQEGGHKFLVNLADYLDVGLFLDHRKTRAMVKKEAAGKDFLNLFAYTGSFTVYAASGGAKSSTTVDTSNTYLDWAKENMRRNGLLRHEHRFEREDSIEFLERTKAEFDVCVVDPPTRSVNKSSGRVFDVQDDHVRLLHLVLDRMRPGGKVFFSTNYRTFTLDEESLCEGYDITVKEITGQTIPLDFERKPSHRCWLITRIPTENTSSARPLIQSVLTRDGVSTSGVTL